MYFDRLDAWNAIVKPIFPFDKFSQTSLALGNFVMVPGEPVLSSILLLWTVDLRRKSSTVTRVTAGIYLPCTFAGNLILHAPNKSNYRTQAVEADGCFGFFSLAWRRIAPQVNLACRQRAWGCCETIALETLGRPASAHVNHVVRRTCSSTSPPFQSSETQPSAGYQLPRSTTNLHATQLGLTIATTKPAPNQQTILVPSLLQKTFSPPALSSPVWTKRSVILLTAGS